MNSVKTVWTWIVSIFIVVLLVIGIVIWKSYQPKPTVAAEKKEVLSNIETTKEQQPISSPENPISGEPAADLPAPAKKLHNLLKDDDGANVNGDELATRIESLNDEMKKINRELEEQGIFVPAYADPQTIENSSVDAAAAEISERIQAMKDFMEQKEQSEGARSN